LKAIKELGQHFLTDSGIAAQIADLGDIKTHERIWEIGPGTGILSKEIISRGATLEAFELDKRMARILGESFGDKIDLILTDILKLNWLHQISMGSLPIKIIANIPYQITSPLLYEIQKHAQYFPLVVLMVQKEVAQRLSAKPGKKEYGPLTLKIGLCYNVKTAFFVNRQYFDPIPKVDSAVIVMNARTTKPDIMHPKIFEKVLTAAFAHRRKTLRNNLLPVLGKNVLSNIEMKIDMDFSRRAETLDEKDFILLSNTIAQL